MRLVSAAGWRIDPPVSVPLAAGARRAATAAAEPPEEPPGTRAGIPGVADRAEETRLVRRAHRELVHVGLAEQHRARRPPPLDHGRVVWRDEVAEHARPAGREDAVGAEDVLVRDRHAGQRPALAARKARIGLARIRERALGGDGHEGVQTRAEPLDTREQVTRDLDARKAARRETGRDFADGESVHYSMTLGTR